MFEGADLGDWVALITMVGGAMGFLGGVVWLLANHGGRIARNTEEIDDLKDRVDDHDEELKIVTRLDERMGQVQQSSQRIEQQNARIEAQNRKIWTKMLELEAARQPHSRTGT